MSNAGIFQAIKRAFPDAVSCCARAPVKTTVESKCIVEVDCNLSFAKMARNSNLVISGNVNQECFPIKGKGKYSAEIALFSFEGHPETGRVIKEIALKGYQPAKIEEIFALAQQHPEIVDNSLIVGLGSTWEFKGKLYSVIIISPMGTNTADIVITELNWCQAFKFAGIKIIPA